MAWAPSNEKGPDIKAIADECHLYNLEIHLCQKNKKEKEGDDVNIGKLWLVLRFVVAY